MNFRTKNGFKDVQVLLKELGLYGGEIDGTWGSGSASGVVELMRSYASFIGRGITTAASMPTKADADGKNVVTQLQLFMADLGVYTMKVDGAWGKGSLGGVNLMAIQYRKAKQLPSYDIAWSTKVPKEFVRRVVAWCNRYNFDPLAPSWLMACMHFESAGTFSPSIQNKAGAQAFGLIQFMWGAAKDLGYTLDQIKAMDQLTQLDLVFKYFEFWMKVGKKFTQLEDFYLTIFYPAAVGKQADVVLFDKNDPKYLKSYTQNKGFDFDKDDKITIGEISTTIYNSYYAGMVPANRLTLS